MFNLDPKGTVDYAGKKIPVILCHYDSYKLGVGCNHGDVYNWFNKHGKTMDDVRNDVAKLMGRQLLPPTPTPTTGLQATSFTSLTTDAFIAKLGPLFVQKTRKRLAF